VTQVFAHRGAHLVERENTLAAFKEARRLGVDGVELDVRRTLDGALVVHHDPGIEGRVISATPADELPSYVPSLADAMACLEGVVVNVEVKNAKEEGSYDESGTLVAEVLDALYGAGHARSISLSSFDLATCVAARSYDADLDVAWLIWFTSLEETLREAHERGFAAVNPHFRLVTADACHLASELGLALNVWTVNEPHDLESMMDLAVTSVITDQPARALELRARRTV
jgi:glycerophosphoryl diester phosphodiesterase